MMSLSKLESVQSTELSFPTIIFYRENLHQNNTKATVTCNNINTIESYFKSIDKLFLTSVNLIYLLQ